MKSKYFSEKSLLCLIAFISSIHCVVGQSTFYDVNVVQKIEIHFDQVNWDYQMDTSYAGADGYIMAKWVKVNGEQFDSVGVKYKGNSSYDLTYIKNPIHLALDEFKKQSYQNYSDIKLGNNYADPSMIREVLSYSILKNYMDCSQSNFAKLYVNDAYIGLYSNDESVNKDFCSAHFYSKKNTFIKCNPLLNPGPNTKSNLKFINGADSTSYFNYYEIKSDYGWNDLVALCDSVTNHGSNISSVFDVDKLIWMLAFNNVLINLDSYSGVFCQNYYLYKDNTNHYNPIVWDLNMCFGGFPFVGNSNNSMTGLTVTSMQQMPLTIHATDPYWPLINALLNNASYKKMYIAHARTIVDELFADSSYITTATQLQSLIDADVLADTNKFFTYSQFQSAMTANNNVGSYVVPGINNLMSARVSYLQSTPEFSAVAPLISSVEVNDTSPDINSSVIIRAQVTNVNSTAVYLNYRYHVTDNFTSLLMYDDGLHNDSTANDNVYAAEIKINSETLQYYLYAENNNAGFFSPHRAAHEFYSLNANIPFSELSQISIYPNPANNELEIIAGRNQDMPFEICNALGEIVYENILSASTIVNTQNWTRGIYFLHTGSTVKKIILMHP